MKWQTQLALFQAERDILRLNDEDRRVMDEARKRIETRRPLLKLIRRQFRNRGLVDVSYDSANPQWIKRADVEAAE